jgi:nucleoid-associated protein YgaU
MKTHTSKPDEDLGAIAAKFGLPSWKYLYQLNKDKIGDNPDLLKAGTVSKIPRWDSTGGGREDRSKGSE